MTKRYRSAAFELKDLDHKTGTFTGYASVFGNLDSYRDVIEHGAFTKTLQEAGGRVKVLWQHDPYVPIGRPTTMKEDDRGLYVEARVSQTSMGKDALILMEDGVINELSIGYSAVKEMWDSDAKVRKLTEVKLWEFSPVTWAANDLALIAGVKNLDELEPAILQLKAFSDELKAGKVLSDKNRTLVEGALASLTQTSDALQALLAAAEPGSKSTQRGSEPPKNEQDPGIQSVLDVLTDMKKFAQRGVA